MNQMAMMTRRRPGPVGLRQAALFLVCLLAVCKADDLMMSEESAELDTSEADKSTSKKLDLVFLVHTSKNVFKQQFSFYKQFMQEIVHNANISPAEVRVGVVIYRKRPNLIFNLKKYQTKETLSDAIRNLKPLRGRMGDIVDSLDFIRTKVLREKAGARLDGSPRAVIILTDMADQKALQKYAKTLKDEDTEIYAVGVGLKDVTQLEAVATMPTDAYKLI